MPYREYRLLPLPPAPSLKTVLVAFFIIAFLWTAGIVAIGITTGCSRYNPALYPSYDVLSPGDQVRLNPISITADGNFVVNGAFLQWVDELKAEIIKLRKGK